MKKIYLFVLSAALLAGGSAYAQNSQQVLTKARLQQLEKSNLPLKATNLKAINMKDVKSSAFVSSVFKAPVSNTVVTDQPAGNYIDDAFRSGFYFAASLFGVSGGTYSNYVGQYVVADDAIYLKNPFNGFATNSWLKLDKGEGDKYIAHLPQAIYDQDNGDGTSTTFYATRLTLTRDGTSLTYAPDSTLSADASFTYKDGTLIQDDSAYVDSLGFPQTIIGITDVDGAWAGFGDAADKFTPNNLTPTAIPQSAIVKDYNYALKSSSLDEFSGEVSENRQLAKVAFDGNDVYINNPGTNDPSSWIKGTIDGNKATFEPQYIGIDSVNHVHLWFVPATYTVVDDSTYADYGIILKARSYTATDKLELAYDADSKTFTAPADNSFVVNAAPDRIYYLAAFDELNLTPWTEVAATPADPSITDVGELYQDYGYAYASVNTPSVDANGILLNPEKIYYNVYTSDDPDNPYELTDDEGYTTYNADPVNIPYSYSDGNDVYSSGDNHTWYIYFDTADIDSLGVQTFYTGGGETRSSNLVWYSLVPAHEAAGINGVADNTAAATKSIAYFDLSGRQVASPKQAGIYIKETTYADGTKKGVKFIKK